MTGNNNSEKSKYHLRYVPLEPTRIWMAIHQVPSCRELAKINQLHNNLRKNIPFFFEVFEEASVSMVVCDPEKRSVIQVQMVISHELELDEAINQLIQSGFMEARESLIS